MKQLLLTFCILLACALPAMAQDAPAPTDQKSNTNKQDPLGIGSLSKDRPAGSKTEVTAQKEATFNDKENHAVFLGDVKVTDPAFLLTADKLTIYLNTSRSGIERAVAEGNVVIVQQVSDPTQKPAVGRARKAEYNPSTGKAVLSGWPEIEQGINRHIASSESTRMILARDGESTTDGPSRTVITDSSTQSPLR